MSSKIKIEQYYDWWFDNALEFLGHLLEEVDIDVEWNRGIAFDSLEEDQIARLVDNIEKLIKFKLTYLKIKKDGTQEKANRAYLPTMHKGKYVNFLGKETKTKQDICDYLFSQEEKTGTKICDICSDNYSDDYDISQVSQTIYPMSTGSLKSQCGIIVIRTSFYNTYYLIKIS